MMDCSSRSERFLQQQGLPPKGSAKPCSAGDERVAANGRSPHAQGDSGAVELIAGAKRASAGSREAEPSLGSKGISATHLASDGVQRRRDRFNLRARLWEMSTLKSVRACGRNLRGGLSAEDGVGVRRGEQTAGYSRLSTCGSPWSCPRCSAVIAVQRAQHIANAIDANSRAGGSAYFLTLTMRHDRGHSLADLWDGLQYGWRGLVGTPEYRGAPGRVGKDGIRSPRRIGEKERFGILGTIRAVELTHGENGWHLHVHALMFMEGDPFENEEHADSYGDLLFKRWSRGVQKAGLPAPLREFGLDFRKVSDGGEEFLSRYLTKNSADGTFSSPSESFKVGLETAAGSITKKGRSVHGRVPFQILRDALEADKEKPLKKRYRWYPPKGYTRVSFGEGEAFINQNPNSDEFGTVKEIDPKTGTVYSIASSDFALWHEFETASKGRRQLIWSQRIKDPKTERDRRWNAILDARGDEADEGDEALADREVDGIDVVGIDYSDWFNKMTRKPSLLWELLEDVEAHPPQDAESVCLSWGERHGIKMWGEGIDPSFFLRLVAA